MNAIKLIWKLLGSYSPPFILPLNWKYNLMSKTDFGHLLTTYMIKELYYRPDIFECDDFAWVFKGLASKQKVQAVGFVIGWWKGLHCWNVVVTDKEVYWVEPQSGKFSRKLKGYYPFVVIV